MISKGDIVRLFNPSEAGLKSTAHMHVITNVKIDEKIRGFVVCTTSPTRYIKQGIKFITVKEAPFRKNTYIRLDPIYSVSNVKIKEISRTSPEFRLNEEKELELFKNIEKSGNTILCEQEFSSLNRVYVCLDN